MYSHGISTSALLHNSASYININHCGCFISESTLNAGTLRGGSYSEMIACNIHFNVAGRRRQRQHEYYTIFVPLVPRLPTAGVPTTHTHPPSIFHSSTVEGDDDDNDSDTVPRVIGCRAPTFRFFPKNVASSEQSCMNMFHYFISENKLLPESELRPFVLVAFGILSQSLSVSPSKFWNGGVKAGTPGCRC